MVAEVSHLLGFPWRPQESKARCVSAALSWNRENPWAEAGKGKQDTKQGEAFGEGMLVKSGSCKFMLGTGFSYPQVQGQLCAVSVAHAGRGQECLFLFPVPWQSSVTAELSCRASPAPCPDGKPGLGLCVRRK